MITDIYILDLLKKNVSILFKEDGTIEFIGLEKVADKINEKIGNELIKISNQKTNY